MPFATTAELPPTIRRLPPHAQEIFLGAFNSARRPYAKRYRKQDESWVPKNW